MTSIDVDWFTRCYRAGLVKGKLLEVGAAKIHGDEPNLCEIARGLGVADSTGADIAAVAGVDAVLDFGLRAETFQTQCSLGSFETVCVFNVLEHTFDPITVLSNALSCLDKEGCLLVVTPAIWRIHNFPGDYNRLLPDWYTEFARRNRLNLLDEHFCWLSEFGIEAISSSPDLPDYQSRGLKASKSRYWRSRIGHKLLNTYGRSHWATLSAIGAAFRST